MKSYIVTAYKKVNYVKVIEAESKKEAKKIFHETVDEIKDNNGVDNYKIEKVIEFVRCG
jgi:uncharacterized lipoprotein YehR (DUF1307 family)